MYTKDYLKDSIKESFKTYGNKLYFNNEKIISNKLKNGNNSEIISTTIQNFIRGSFYFVYYDLQGKSSAMEKFNPILLLDNFDINNTRTYFVLNLNFLPVTIRVLFFNNILNYNLDIIEYNNEQDTLKQKSLDGINFVNIYNMLKRIGFEWAIRKLDIKLINKIYKINTNLLPEFITMSTHTFTKVDDNKLVQIWQKKIKEQTEREQKLINSLINDLESIDNDFKEQYKTLQTKTDNLVESLKIINNL